MKIGKDAEIESSVMDSENLQAGAANSSANLYKAYMTADHKESVASLKAKFSK